MDVWIGTTRFDVYDLIDEKLTILLPHDPDTRDKIAKQMKDLLHLAVRDAVTEVGRRERSLLYTRTILACRAEN